MLSYQPEKRKETALILFHSAAMSTEEENWLPPINIYIRTNYYRVPLNEDAGYGGMDTFGLREENI